MSALSSAVPEPTALGQLRRERLLSSRLYVCTDLERFVSPDVDPVDALNISAFRDFLVAAFSGGVDIIQVRDKNVSATTELTALSLLADVASEFGGLSIANDRADLAAIAEVDGLHLGQDDISAQYARGIVGDDVIVGLSCRTEDQVHSADSDVNLDYFCTGPIWETPTKPGRAAVGFDLPRMAASLESAKPFFAIGGINADNVDQVREAGADRIVVVRAVSGAEDTYQAAQALRQALPA